MKKIKILTAGRIKLPYFGTFQEMRLPATIPYSSAAEMICRSHKLKFEIIDEVEASVPKVDPIKEEAPKVEEVLPELKDELVKELEKEGVIAEEVVAGQELPDPNELAKQEEAKKLVAEEKAKKKAKEQKEKEKKAKEQKAKK